MQGGVRAAPGAPIGRDEERRVIASYLTQGESVAIAGAPGVGKTHLARAVHAEMSGTPPWLAATRSSRAIPFAALAPLLSFARSDVDWSAGDILRTARDALVAAGAGEVPVLFVDDAHLLDDASATLVHQIVTTSSAVAVLTLTSGEPAPDAITALWKDGYASRVELQPLTRTETDDLVTSLLDGPCSHLALYTLWRTSEGNPLFVSELVHAARSAGALRAVEGRWNLRGSLPVGARLAELIGVRVDELSDNVRATVEIVAGAEPVPLALLERIVGLGAIADAEHAGVIDVTVPAALGMARIAHPTYAEAIRARTPKARLRDAFRRLADAADQHGLKGRDDVLRYVTWRLDAGEHAPTEMLIDASWRASEAHDTELAERLARVAVDDNPHHHSARLALADAQYRRRNHRDALATLAVDTADGDRSRTEIAILTSKTLCCLGRSDEAEQILRDAEAQVADPTFRAWLVGFAATLRVTLGHPRDAIEMAERIVDDDKVGPRGRLAGLSAVAMGFAFAGRRHDVATTIMRANDPSLQSGTDLRTNLSWAAPASWVAAWTTGDLDEAESLARAFRDLGTQRRLSEWVGAGSVGLGWVALLRGDVNGALELLREGMPQADDDWFGANTLGIAGVGTLARAGLVWATSMAGDAPAALRATATVDGAGERGARWFDGCAEIGHGWACATDGDELRAFEVLCGVATAARARGEVPYELHALHLMARLGRPRDVTDRLTDIAREVHGSFAPACAAHAGALAADDGVALDEASGMFERIGMLLLAAEASAAAAGAHDRAGSSARAEGARRRASTLLERCPGARPPTLERLRLRATLTAREAEVAALAARGLSSRDIADRLVVSVRTVDSHLAHIYNKLGVGSRRELAVMTGDTNSVS